MVGRNLRPSPSLMAVACPWDFPWRSEAASRVLSPIESPSVWRMGGRDGRGSRDGRRGSRDGGRGGGGDGHGV